MPELPQKINGFRSKVINELIDFVASLQPIRSYSIRHSWTSRGVALEVAEIQGGVGDNAEDWAFGVTVAGNQVTVQAGAIYVQGHKRHDFAKATGTATGEYCWPTIRIPVAFPLLTPPTLQMLAALPDPDTTYIYIPLVRLVCTSYPTDESSYSTDGDGHILHRGNIQLGNPLVFG